MRIKSWLVRSKNLEEAVSHRVSMAMRKREEKYMQDLDEIRLTNRRRIDNMELDMDKENERVKQQIGKDYELQLKGVKAKHENRINGLIEENKDMKEKVLFAQDFWRGVIHTAEQLTNISLSLESKCMLNLEKEKEELSSRMCAKAEGLQSISQEVEKLHKIQIRITKKAKEGDKLLSILEEVE